MLHRVMSTISIDVPLVPFRVLVLFTTLALLASALLLPPTGSITAGTSFIIGSADLNETDMEKLDGITNGTAAANKALVARRSNVDIAPLS